MVPRQENINRSVSFTPDSVDQTLIAAVEKELAKKRYSNFSDLCKQALRQFFLLSYTPPISKTGHMEQQLIELHIKFAELEQKLLARGNSQLEEIEGQLHQLTQPSKTEQIEQQLSELHLKFAELEQKLLAKDTSHLEEIEGQLYQLTQHSKTEQVEQQLSELHLKFAELEQKLLAKDTSWFEKIEDQLHQLTQQLQDREAKFQQVPLEPEAKSRQTLLEPESNFQQALPEPEAIALDLDKEIDPLLSRLGPLFHDF